MLKRHKFPLYGVLVAAIVVIAGLGSYALAQSGDSGQAPATQSDGTSRHVDYDVNLQVAGDLSAVNPKLQGILPLNLEATGSADVQKGDSGPQVQGNLQLSGVDAIVQKLTAGNGGGGNAALGGLVNGALSDLQFVAVDKDVYVKLGGAWYDTGSLEGHHGQKPDAENSGGASKPDKAAIAAAFPGGPKALLKDVKTVGQENIDGVTATHTSATVDVDKALTEASTAARNAGKTAEADRLDAARAQIESAVKQVNLDWWIDGSGNLVQARAAVEINPSSLAGLVPQKAGSTDSARIDSVLKGITSVKLDATVKFSHFGESFQIARPDGTITPLKDLIGPFGVHKGGSDSGQPGGHRGRGTGTSTNG
ncbi:MAG: LolA-like protein [Thermoleophilia bacterium]